MLTVTLVKLLLDSWQLYPDPTMVWLLAPLPPPTVVDVNGHLLDTSISRLAAVSKAASSCCHTLSCKDGNTNSVALLDSDSKDNVIQQGRGRPLGAGNFTDKDLQALLDIVAHVLPAGAHGWCKVQWTFAHWSCKNSQPERTVKSIESKYKQVCTLDLKESFALT